MDTNGNMDDHSAAEGTRAEPEVLSNIPTPEIKTSDLYNVDKNLPVRFNNPGCFRGYSQNPKRINPLYQTTNQIYGSKQPSVHEMPITFNGSQRKFSEHLLKTGMFRDNGFNTTLDKSRISGPNSASVFHERISFHHVYQTDGKSQ